MTPNAILKKYLKDQERRCRVRVHLAVSWMTNRRDYGYRANTTIYAASTVKVAILLALLKLYEEGKIDLNERIIFEKRHTNDPIASKSSGILRLMTPPLELSVYNTAVLMIAYSDNIASDRLIELIEGLNDAKGSSDFPSINKVIQKLGARRTSLEVSFCNPAVRDRNFTTARDLTNIMRRLYSGSFFQKSATHRIMFEIFKTTRNNTGRLGALSARGIEVFHKGGSNPHIVLDTGIVSLHKTLLALTIAVMPESRTFSDEREKCSAEKLIEEVAWKVIQYLL